jgi:hypothetical protein
MADGARSRDQGHSATTAKDLEIAARLTEALVRLDGLAGLAGIDTEVSRHHGCTR